MVKLAYSRMIQPYRNVARTVLIEPHIWLLRNPGLVARGLSRTLNAQYPEQLQNHVEAEESSERDSEPGQGARPTKWGLPVRGHDVRVFWSLLAHWAFGRAF